MARRDEASTGELSAVLGRGSSFEGKLTFEGTVRIEGRFSGEIHAADTLVVGQGADVKAEIFAGTVIVSGGRITGNVRATKGIELEKAGRIEGNIETPSLKIEKGAIFQGNSKMENLDKPAAKTPANEVVPASR